MEEIREIKLLLTGLSSRQIDEIRRYMLRRCGIWCTREGLVQEIYERIPDPVEELIEVLA